MIACDEATPREYGDQIMTELTCTAATVDAQGGARVDAIDISRRVGGRQILQKLSLSVEPGELVAIAGGSGAGKTTLLEVLAGLQPPSAGELRHDGVARRSTHHHRLPSRLRAPGRHHPPRDAPAPHAALRGAARLPAATSAAEAERIVEETLQDLDLADRADVPVRALSGGQRKRASIAVELLTRPRLFFLDEPTSGLDPSTAAEVMRLLRRLSRRGVTVVVTTHEPAGIDRCDRVVFLARDGHLAFTGSPAAARRYFGVEDLTEVYERLAGEHSSANLGGEIRGKPRQRINPPWLNPTARPDHPVRRQAHR